MTSYELLDEVGDEVWLCAPPQRRVLQKRSVDVASELLGMLISKGSLGLIITEVEAYGGPDDAASHAHRGLSSRNGSMFDDGGTLYVYLSYGIHKCVNVVTGTPGNGEAILIRGGIAVEAEKDGRALNGLHGTYVSGPGRVGKMLGAQLADDGLDLLGSSAWGLLDSRGLTVVDNFDVVRSRRVGISKATDLEWRFELRLR